MTDPPKVVVEVRKGRLIFRVEGTTESQLEEGLSLAIAFAKKNERKLRLFDSLPVASEGTNEKEESRGQALPDYKFPDWFHANNVSTIDALATLLYDLGIPLTTGQIAKIIAKAWKPMDLRNVSKMLTSRGKYLFPYVYRDEKTTGIALTAVGRRWYEREVLPRLQGV